MRRVFAIAAVCFVIGCGDDGGEDTPAARLEGHWLTTDPNFACIYGFSFREEDHLIESKEACELTDGSMAIVIDSGTFEADYESFTWEIEASSCRYASTWPATVQYEIDGDELTLWTPDGVLILKRIEESSDGSGGAFAFGCFDEEGFFEPMSISPVKSRARRKLRGPITRAPGWAAVAQQTAR